MAFSTLIFGFFNDSLPPAEFATALLIPYRIAQPTLPSQRLKLLLAEWTSYTQEESDRLRKKFEMVCAVFPATVKDSLIWLSNAPDFASSLEPVRAAAAPPAGPVGLAFVPGRAVHSRLLVACDQPSYLDECPAKVFHDRLKAGGFHFSTIGMSDSDGPIIRVNADTHAHPGAAEAAATTTATADGSAVISVTGTGEQLPVVLGATTCATPRASSRRQRRMDSEPSCT